MARNAIESEFRTSKMADRSEMARNAIESDFLTSKMAAEKKNSVSIWNGHRIVIESEFRTSKNGRLKKKMKWPELLSKMNFRHPKWPIDLKWPEMRSKVNFGHPKSASDHFVKKSKKSFILNWNGQKCHRKCISDIHNGHRQPFCKQKTFTKKVARVIWTMFKPTAGQLQIHFWSIYIYRQVCWERGNIHCVHPLGRMHTILVIVVFNSI